MWNMNKVIEINYQQGYIFNVVFDDGTCGNVDFSEYIGKWAILTCLKQPVLMAAQSLGRMVQISLPNHSMKK
jgi:hypothetical protein